MRKTSVLLCSIILGIFVVEPQLLALEFQQIRNKFVRAEKRIPDQYIVVLKDDPVLKESKGADLTNPSTAVQSVANDLIRRHGGIQKYTYAFALKGFSVQMFESQALGLSQDSRVLFVEEVGEVSLAHLSQHNAPWGLDRIDQRDRPLNNIYYYNYSTGVNVFVIDTGIRYSHQQFGGRAFPAYGVPGENNVDVHGHGTHVAGIIGGSTYGVAKHVKLHSVRVFPSNRAGTTQDVIMGIDWVAQHHNDPQYSGPDVANMSFELPATSADANALDFAVQGLINAGVTCVVAAGNNNTQANLVSPARVPAAITVSASTSTDSRVISFNSQPNPNDCYSPVNYPVNANSGSVVDLFAPGREIISAKWNDDMGTCVLTGTSMSTAFVSGIAASYLHINPGASPAEVQNAIVTSSTPSRLSNIPNGTPNQLLYSNIDNARFIAQTPPPSFMSANQTASVSITMKNIGTTYWSAGQFYRLGSQNPDNNMTWGMGRVELPGIVSPNSEVTFNFTVTAPTAPGAYNFQWRMLKELELWFGDITPNIPVTVNATSQPVNVALASNGGIVTASTTINNNYPTAAANNGDRKGINWGAGGGWNDATSNIFPDWIQVDFNGNKTINEIGVFTLQDNFSNPIEPTPTTTFNYYGVIAFNVQYWNGSTWVTIPGGSVTGNNLVWRRFTFSSIYTSKIRVTINNAVNSYSRIVELEAYSQ